MLTNGVMTINEVRSLENLPPVEGGDEAGGDQGLQEGRQPPILEGGRRLAKGRPARPVGARQGPALALAPEARARQDVKDGGLRLFPRRRLTR